MELPHFLLDPWIRRKARLASIDLGRFQIRLARSAKEYEDAFRLIHLAYAYQGIEPLRRLDLRVTEQHVLSEAVVLVAYEGEQLVGTISVTKDSPAKLPLDKDYGDEITTLRRSGAQISEIGSLAIVRRCWHSGLMPLLGLAASRVCFRIHGSTHNVIGVHPKAAAVYHAMWNFHQLGNAHHHAELEAPVIGLVQERSATQTHLIKHYRAYPNGLNPAEYCFGESSPSGLELPEGVAEQAWPRLKMPREVFRSIFIEQTGLLSKLSPATLHHLRTQRSEETVGVRAQAPQVLKDVNVS